MKTITLVTGNLDKVKWLKKFTNLPLDHKNIDLAEIQSLDVYEIVEHKAKEAFKQIKQPVLIEDTSLVFNALGKLPGPLIKWFLKELGNEGLCQLLNSFEDRSAQAEIVYCYYDGKEFKLAGSKLKGKISQTPKGTNSFGWDPIFIPDGWNKTCGEMSDEEIISISARRAAFLKLEKYFKQP